MALDKNKISSVKPNARTGLGVVFLTIFIDLVGFSIIFPLFPDMLDHYLAQEADKGGILTQLTANLPERSANGLNLQTVLFGGILGSLYSMLQFIFAPIWGGLSDRVGRRKVLLYTVFATAIGYAVWIFSGNILMLILSRIIAGIASGNIAVATAAVADITSRENRAKGMALVGIAFGLGFVVGPAIGGISANWSRGWEGYGLNPFSFPAIISCFLALINLYQVKKRFKETLPNLKHGAPKEALPEKERYPIFSLFRIGSQPVMLLCLLHLVFYTAFSGMEFTLTFLAKERLKFDATFNGYMFIVIGITMIVVQGVFVRRLAKPLGEKNLALIGVIFGMVAFILLGTAPDIIVNKFFSRNFFMSQFIVGLVCMSCAIGLISPCISALVSLHSKPDEQGRNLGLLRSAGALARVIGPILAGSLYFIHSAEISYKAGAAILIIPLLLTFFVKSPEQKN